MCGVNTEMQSSVWIFLRFFLQAEDGIRDLVRSRGLGDVYKRQVYDSIVFKDSTMSSPLSIETTGESIEQAIAKGLALSLIHI